MKFQEEYCLIRIRRRASGLWFGYFVLAVCSGLITWLTLRQIESWIAVTAYVLIGFVLLFGWLIPTWRYASNFTDVTTSRIIQRGGPFARTRRETSHASVSGIEYQRGSGIAILVRDSEPIQLRKVPRPKALAADLQKTLAK